MNQLTRELPLLCILASLSGMLAWALDSPLFVAVFVAQATVAFLGLARQLI